MDPSIALAQVDPVLGDIEQNVELHLSAASEAHDRGAHVVVFPELSLTGYSIQDMNLGLAFNIATPPASINPLLKMSKEISIILGAIEEDESFRIYNAAFLLQDATIRSVHRKVYLPTYGMFEEHRHFSPGTIVQPFESKGGLLGVAICEDFWHLPVPYLLAQQGAKLLIAMAASPTRTSGRSGRLGIAEANTGNHRTFGRLLSCYIGYCNRVGFEDGLNFWGGSHIVGPDGALITEGKMFEADLVAATLPMSSIRTARQTSRHFLDDDPEFVRSELARIASSV